MHGSPAAPTEKSGAAKEHPNHDSRMYESERRSINADTADDKLSPVNYSVRLATGLHRVDAPSILLWRMAVAIVFIGAPLMAEPNKF